MARSVPWLWVYCCDYQCGHHRAVALVPWAIRWGVGDPAKLIEERFYCIMCGHRGATLRHANIQQRLRDYAAFPVDRPVGIGGRRHIGE